MKDELKCSFDIVPASRSDKEIEDPHVLGDSGKNRRAFPDEGRAHWWKWQACAAHRYRAAAEDPPKTGDWVLVHVGFAMSKISEEQALDQLQHADHAGRRRRRRWKR